MMKILSLLLMLFYAVAASPDFSQIHPMEVNAVVSARVSCATTQGDLSIEVIRDWGPLGADRFMDMVRSQFFDEISFYRSVEGFLTQFGANNEPSKARFSKTIIDDKSHQMPFRKGYMSFAGSGPNSRNSQLFITYADQPHLGDGSPWEVPFARVPLTPQNQMVLDGIYKGYGDIPPFGSGPDQQRIFREGNAYIRREFPKTDFILRCNIVEEVSKISTKEDNTDGLDHHRELLAVPKRQVLEDVRTRVFANSNRRVKKAWLNEKNNQAQAVKPIRPVEEILEIENLEEERRNNGEEVVEELTDEELAVYKKEVMNHHGPMEAPPHEFSLFLIFVAGVFVTWKLLASKKKNGLLDVKKS